MGYLPLGLELVGRYIYNDEFLSIEETLDLLKGEKLKAEALNPHEDEGDMTAQLGVAAAFKLSWDKLSASRVNTKMKLKIINKICYIVGVNGR